MIEKLIKKILSEATSDAGGNRGSYIAPLQMGVRRFKNAENGPFTELVSKYNSPELEYDSYDGKMDTPKNKIKKLERIADKVTRYIKNHPNATRSDEDGNNINPTPGKKNKIVPIEVKGKKINEATTNSTRRGDYLSPLLPGYRVFEKNINGPFTEYVTDWDDAGLEHDSLDGNMSTDSKTVKKRERAAEKMQKKVQKREDDSFTYADEGGVMNGIPLQNIDAKPIKNYDPKKTTVSLNGVKKLGEWVELDKIPLNEDLAVWFGTKKKPKGSKQPKGPWVNICRKVDGKHPPCGRPDTDKGGYPKCRAAGVAGKMSDSEKKSACQQKRNAEKKDTQSGKGQKPVMTSYKPKKTQKESLDIIVRNILSSL
jgi:hypothetical protein